jgi:DNA repair protein RecO
MAREARQFSTLGIILSRTDYGEADRILSFITPDHGKVKAIAKGVRKAGAKLAGAIELFSVSELTFIAGRGEAYTIISARLKKHHGGIVKDLERTNTAYELTSVLNKATEDKTEEAYFELLDKALTGLGDTAVSPAVTDVWFRMQLLKLDGHSPELKTDAAGNALQESAAYNFDIDKMRFSQSRRGAFTSKEIKFMRFGFAAATPGVMQRVQGVEKLVATVQPLIQSMLSGFVRL